MLALVVGALGWKPSKSRADGDPASDVLLAQDVFYPYQPTVSPSFEAALEKTLRAAAATGLRLKVAIIGQASELGLEPQFFGRPQAYAQFLDREISFNQPQSLLVVMPAGFGVMPRSLASGLARLRLSKQGQRSDDLTHSAILAVVALARYQGHPIATPSLSPTSSKSSPPALLVFGLPAAVLALAGLALMRRGSSGR